jgi:hypothetical protein
MNIVATYDYRDEAGALLFQVCRAEPKRFFQRASDGNGGWLRDEHNKLTMKGVQRVLYRVPQLLAAPADKVVFLVEGEKDVDRLYEQGAIATTSPGGASLGKSKSKWLPEYNNFLAGRRVVALPDNDEAGRAHMEAAARSLAGKAAEIRILELPGLAEHGDVSDWLDSGGTLDELQRLAAAAPVFTASAAPKEEAGSESAGLPHYEMTDSGLYFPAGGDEGRQWLSAPFKVLAQTRNSE